ncbi:outer membrane protein assembly factor BamB family protein [Natronorubrum texcoconense]|uniref:Outer membrane protein assembly factor BamB, contains PQQ-like beta-propeller repeat n=1 Tax=Natronorubrum texcoconense TaxID=1095776 RepID=A0A1G8YMU2_9EURY|nr:PQQ-binding-like beta-propeller repeat protein [Natronorubrum texcoconense]SDK04159.1 Outer membrane protein assembly factor BamB, contains PQQ-like beta-propeller repeat [Natronorubrum texcoconense]
MPTWKRRSVLATGAALSLGGLSSIGTGSEADDATELPDSSIDPNPETDEDWPSYDGGAGHSRSISDTREFDGEALEAAWSVAIDSGRGEFGAAVAVADDTVYAKTESAVVALEAADGSVVWEADDVDAWGPAVAGETVALSGEEVVALDRADGSVRWTTEFDPENRGDVSRHTVAYDAVFVIFDGTLYALEIDDGSIRWRLESIRDEDGEEHEFDTDVAAANGVVYAVSGDFVLALEPESGDERWRSEVYNGAVSLPSRATATGVLLGGDMYERSISDAESGEGIGVVNSEYIEPVLDEEMYVDGGPHTFSGRSYAADDEYEWDVDIHYSSVSTVITGDTVYAYVDEANHPPNAEYSADLVALDRFDGTERWVRSADETPVGPIRAISGETIYVDHDGELVALREQTDEEGGDDQPDEDNESGEDDDGSGDDGADDDTDEGDDEQSGSEDDDQQQDGEDNTDEAESDGDDQQQDGDSESGEGDTDAGSEAGDEDTDTEVDAENETETDVSDDTDGVPGFTTGAGLLGGATALEWLRRTSGADESTSVNEPAK